MNMKRVRTLFIIAALYEGLLGVVFFFFAQGIFKTFGVEPPNHLAYVEFPALLLLVFAVMFIRIACDPTKNRELILYGIALKAAYCGTAFWYQVTQGIPSMWLPWAWLDLAFLLLFILAWRSARPLPGSQDS
ncbi:MAG: hypothetical protein FWC49_01995 [Proteobacteria bacterium]|nr:hypothetical protein [Pseudomonadota bacterium]